MRYGLEIVDLVAVLGTSCLMLALFVAWHSISSAVFKVRLPEHAERTQYTRLLAAFAALFVSLLGVAYAVALAPLMRIEPLFVAVGVYAVTVSIGGIYALMQGNPLRTFVAQSFFGAAVILGGAIVFIFWPS